MFDPNLVEAVARGMLKWPDVVLCDWPTAGGGRHKKLAWEGRSKDRAMDALTALCAHLRLPPEALNALAAGEAVVVPREATRDMLRAAAREDDAAYRTGLQHGATDEAIYDAMLAASPYAPQGGGDA